MHVCILQTFPRGLFSLAKPFKKLRDHTLHLYVNWTPALQLVPYEVVVQLGTAAAALIPTELSTTSGAISEGTEPVTRLKVRAVAARAIAN